MEERSKKISTKKYIAIAFMAAAFLLLCMNWLKLGNETRELIEETREELEDDLDRQMDYWDADDAEELYDEQGYSSKEVKKMVKATDAIFDILDKAEKGKFSVFTLIGANSDISAMKPALTDEDISGSDAEEAGIVFAVGQIVLWIVIIMFVIDGGFMLFAIFCYIKERKAYGVISAILSGLMFIGLGGLMFLIKVGTEDWGNGITFAPILTFICCLVSCIVWRSARKMMEQQNQNMYNQYPPYQNPPYQNGGYQGQSY